MYFIVLIRPAESHFLSTPLGLLCKVDNGTDAEEQARLAHKDCEVLWITEGSDLNEALNDYYDYKDCHEPTSNTGDYHAD